MHSVVTAIVTTWFECESDWDKVIKCGLYEPRFGFFNTAASRKRASFVFPILLQLITDQWITSPVH